MHQHNCRHCEKDFVCAKPIECFRTKISCADCFWTTDVPGSVFGMLIGLLIVAAFIQVITDFFVQTAK